MTIALGLIARGGVVLAADTQESAGYWKRNRGKLSAAFHQSQSGRGHAYMMCWSGSSAHYQGLRAELQAAFDKKWKEATSPDTKLPDPMPSAAVKSVFADVVNQFFVERLLPFAAYPQAERPEVSVLIAHDNRHETSLWASHENMLLDVASYHAVGIGADMALSILARSYRLPLLDIRRTIMLAAYVMAQVKDSVEGCGKSTDLFFIKQHKLGFLDRVMTAEIEEAMRSYAAFVEPAGLREILGEPWLDGAKRTKQTRASIRRLLPRILAAVGKDDD